MTKFGPCLVINSIDPITNSLPDNSSKPENDDLYTTDSCFEKPYRCPHPKINFYLYTRRTQNSPEKMDVLDPDALYYTHFNPSHPTKLVIHGFGGGRNLSPSTDMREAYFKHGDYNIVIVDYSTAVKGESHYSIIIIVHEINYNNFFT